MRKGIVVCLFFLMTGCVALTQSGHKQTSSETESFQKALMPLFKKNDSGPIKLFIKENPDSTIAIDAEQILQIYNSNLSYQKKLKTCNQQADASKIELEKLQADIERLTQLHLKMGRNDQ